MKQAFFNIPETKAEIKAEIDEIMKRNMNLSQVPKIDFIFMIQLIQAFYMIDDEQENANG